MSSPAVLNCACIKAALKTAPKQTAGPSSTGTGRNETPFLPQIDTDRNAHSSTLRTTAIYSILAKRRQYFGSTVIPPPLESWKELHAVHV